MRIEELLYKKKDSLEIAIEFETNIITYKDWYIDALEIADILKRLKVRRDNVAIYIPNSIYYAISYFGILFSENVIVPIYPKSTIAEIFRDLKYCECHVILTTTFHFDKIKKLFQNYYYMLKIVYVDTGVIEVLNATKQLIPKTNYIQNDGSNSDVMLLLHTSGTTSSPKRVMLTHKNLICNIKSNVSSLQLTNQDVGLIALPMVFGYCNTAQFLSYLYVGAKFVIMPSLFYPSIFFNIVETKRITNFTAVPTMLNMLLKFQNEKQYDYCSLKYVCFGGGFISPVVLRELVEKFPKVHFIQTYGQTECSPRVTALLPPFTITKMGSVGRPIPNVDIKVISDNGIECNAGEVGTIFVKGNNVMKGYYKNPDATELIIKNGWVNTGDIGYIDNDGFLFLKGRNKNIIISGGINIYPEEVEEIIKEIDGVEQVCVRGKYDEEMGEVPIAEVVRKYEWLTEKNILKYCYEKLSFYKVPKFIEFVEKIQVTYNGKIKR